MNVKNTTEELFLMTAKTLFGLEPILAEELTAIGATDVIVHNRAVSFKGTTETLYKGNYLCRTALRILVPIKTAEVSTQEELYKAISQINWEQYIDATDTIAIDSVAGETTGFTNSMFVSLKAKDAIVDQFRAKHGVRPSVDIEFPTLRINIHIFKSTCTISLDSSGKSLHKRGYRVDASKAPLNEVLAAGLVLLSGWDKKSNFVDPMCGSGTILIEAAMIAKNIPPGYYRKEFGFEKWKNFDKECWENILEESKKNIIETNTIILGNDNATSTIKIAKINLKEAGFRDAVKLVQEDMREMTPPEGGGTAIINPPYGERLDKDDILELYKSIGDTLKKKYEGYNVWIITSNSDAAKNIGLKTSRKIPIFNGPLECRFLKFEMYRGTKKFRPEEGTVVSNE